MTDQTIPADLTPEEVEAAREWATSYLAGFYKPGHADAAARALTALLPTPSRPTLADMTPRERRACQWLQADVKGVETRAVIVNPHEEDGTASVVWPGGFNEPADWEEVTPRPDLPRREWPGDEKPAPALPEGWRLADHPDFGRVIVTNTTGRNGHVYVVLPAEYGRGFDWHLCAPGELTYIDQEADTADTVPESTLAVGSEWGDADALAQACRESGREQIVVVDTRGTAGMWDKGLWGWRASVPDAKFTPYTIIHIGREDDQ